MTLGLKERKIHPMRTYLVCALLMFLFNISGAAEGLTAAPREEVYLVPFSHLDLFWGGTQEECLSRGNHIIMRAIQVASKHPEFRFVIEDEVFAANFVETHAGTAELAELKRLIKEGRIEIAPKWAAIYQNLPPSEVLVRNMVYGKRYAREMFGVDPQVANLTDLPGFTRQFPQILKRSNVPFAVMTRVGPTDKSLFYWNSPDGSKALTWNMLKGYGWGTFLTSRKLSEEEKAERLTKDVADVRKTTQGPIEMNWGSDLLSVPADMVEQINALNKLQSPRLVFSTFTEFFHRAEKTPAIPEFSGELPHAWGNLLTSMAPLLPPAVSAADSLVTAEKFAALSYALGYGSYPQQDFDLLWKKVIESFDHNNFGQGGDIGDARKLEYAELATVRGGEILRDSLRNIAERVKNPIGKGTPIVVFNPLSWQRNDVVKAHVSLYGDVLTGDLDEYRKGVLLVDETGTPVPFHQEVESGTVSRALEIVFVAQAVPALGYKTYFVVPADHPYDVSNTSELTLDGPQKRIIGNDEIESEFYRVTVDRVTGRISLFDKALNRTVAKDIEMIASEERGGNSISIEPFTGRIFINRVNRVEVQENNPVRTVVRIEGDLGGIPVVQKLTLYRGLKRVDLEDTIDWQPGKLVNIEQLFPYDHPRAEIQYGIPFGTAAFSDVMPNTGPRGGDEISREQWARWSQVQDWISAGDSEWQLTVAADHKVMSVRESVIRAGMLRGTYQTTGLTRDGKSELLSIPPAGRYVFRYSLSSSKGDWKAAKSYRTGMDFNNALIPVPSAADLSPKSLPPTQSLCSVGADNLIVSALKKADGDGAVVLRLFEIDGAPADARIEFLNKERGFREVNLLEEDISSSEQKTLAVRPFEIRTLKMGIK